MSINLKKANKKANKGQTIMTTEQKVLKDREVLFNLIMENCQKIGDELVVYIPYDLLFVDNRYQRNMEDSKAKIRQLAENWTTWKLDPLVVSCHPEENRFAIIDGMHRYWAGQITKKVEVKGFTCRLVQGLSIDPEERLKQEAYIFSTQGDEVEKLTPLQRHKANILLGKEENITLQKAIEKWDVRLKPERGRGRAKVGHLAGFSAALTSAKFGTIDDVFEVICKARWNLATNGFKADVIRSIEMILRLHNEAKANVKTEMINYFINIEPEKFFAEAAVKYPERRNQERLTLLLEDKVCENLNIARVYFGEKKRIA